MGNKKTKKPQADRGTAPGMPSAALQNLKSSLTLLSLFGRPFPPALLPTLVRCLVSVTLL